MKKPSKAKTKTHRGAQKGRARKVAVGQVAASGKVNAASADKRKAKTKDQAKPRGATEVRPSGPGLALARTAQRARRLQGAIALAKAYPAEDRQALALLALPMVALLLAFGVMQAAKHARHQSGAEISSLTAPADVRTVDRAGIAQVRIVPPSPIGAAAGPAAALSERVPDVAVIARGRAPLAGHRAPNTADASKAVPRTLAAKGDIPIARAAGMAVEIGATGTGSLAASRVRPVIAVAEPGPIRETAAGPDAVAIEVASVPPVVAERGAPAAEVASMGGPRSILADRAAPGVVRPGTLPMGLTAFKDVPALSMPIDGAKLAMLAPSTSVDGITEPRISAPPVVASQDEPGDGPQLCLAKPSAARGLRAIAQSLTPAAFGSALAETARGQTADLVIYNDTYRHMAYPMGDVPALYGVCTDVVIRAYRGMGIDLQQRVHESGLGSGDTSIEHRRTETLRRFFARYGEQLPASTFAEDFWPGDIVTYNRPQNRHSRSHIAVVSDVTGASGAYMIVHNRGWGPQLEDALFVDEITGHYRYSGGGGPVVAAVPASVSGALAAAQSALGAATGVSAVSCRSVARGRPRTLCLQQAAMSERRPQREGAPVSGLGR